MTQNIITRDDLEEKLREIEGVVDTATRGVSRWVIGGLVVVTAVFVGWKIYRSRTQKITVEVYTHE
ncbi:MAG: hypothetical protein BMS9Abin07_0216 [Acidimicrobiia bacterium]|nr:MAG: hypothetical protein BMS9Abin07_0216 [Acidimicrobiia bacterium]